MIKTINNEHQAALVALAEVSKLNGIKELFSNDFNRASDYSFDVDGLLFDFSKSHITRKLIDVYQEIAADTGWTKKRHDLFSGVKINTSENRAVLHSLLRDPNNQGIETVERRYIDEAHDAEDQFRTQFKQIQLDLSERKIPVTDIIHVGIGGSSLGTKLIYQALRSVNSKIKVHFISNIDAHELLDVLHQCNVKQTMVIGVSKTFQTTETLTNIKTIGTWFKKNGVEDYLEHVYAVTAKPECAIRYGIKESNIITFPEWVGGRYSVWSSVSLSAVIAIGLDKFEEFLKGAAQIDQYFYQTELSQNVCFIAAALDHFNTNYLGTSSKAIFAYDYRFRSLVNYLQQLETESNGKDRQINGEPVDQKTSPVVWGGVGTDVQHSVFQMLHQGTSIIPAEFLLVAKADHEMSETHRELLSNGLAQTAALLSGQDLETVLGQDKTIDVNSKESISEAKSKIFSGDRPSTTILIDKLTPRTLGTLLAFYEHRTFSYGVIANINSFDQMGVELGKRLANEVKPLLSNDVSENIEAEDGAVEGIDPSTISLINRINSYNT